MDQKQKHQILKYGLTFFLLIFSFLLWWSVDRAIFVEEASVWTAPIVWSSLFFAALSLGVFLIREKYFLYLAVSVSFLSSLYFSFSAPSFSVFQLLFLIISSLLVVYALKKISDDFDSRLKIDLGKNIRSGSALIVLALSLAISMQYYFETRNLATEKYLPQFEIGKGTNGLMLKLVSGFFPQAKDLGDENLTVDQFLIRMYEKQKSESQTEGDSLLEAQLRGLDPNQRLSAEKTIREAETAMMLTEGKKQLSKIALREVEGSEKISDVFSEIVNKKINSYFMPSLGRGESSSVFPVIIALVIFLTALSLGSFLMFFWILFVRLTFFTLKQSGAVSVVRIPAEKEVIE